AEMSGVKLNYGEANQRANKIAHSLLSASLSKGDHFAYLSKNSIDMALTYYGASKIGVIPVPLNYRLAPPEWLHIINDAESRLVIVEEEFIEDLETVCADFNQVANLIGISASVPEGWSTYDAWLVDQDDQPEAEISATDQLYQMYTSGTTGLPKGAMIAQRCADADVRMASALFDAGIGSDRSLIVAPMYHAAAMIGLMVSISHGASLLIHREFSPVDVVRALSEEHITSVLMVPAMIQACLVAVPDVGQRTYPELRMMMYGGSAIAAEVLREAMRIFDCGFVQGFGLTETTAIAAGLNQDDHRNAIGSKPDLLLAAGRPLLGTRIKIVDEDGTGGPAWNRRGSPDQGSAGDDGLLEYARSHTGGTRRRMAAFG
ncbi:MAG: AMP-binding protein, partial [Gammaproteobacteria bacterium]|nr:AMP-binding protein [Gammaproteobacteria bacterium]